MPLLSSQAALHSGHMTHYCSPNALPERDLGPPPLRSYLFLYGGLTRFSA
jgi:hypothetical protein